jgi:hypothetical protein
MDKTMEYYFIRNPKKLISIYDQVLANLSEMETRFENESALPIDDPINLWPGKESYYFPDILVPDSTQFEININKRGIYSLAFSAILYPDDQSYNPRITIYSCHPDSIKTGKKHYIETINYLKDGNQHNYQLTINVLKHNPMLLRGRLYNFDNNPEKSEQHMIINNISLIYNKTLR